MDVAEARAKLAQAGYLLADRSSQYFGNEIVLSWRSLGAIGVLCQSGNDVHPGEVEAFLANAERASNG